MTRNPLIAFLLALGLACPGVAPAQSAGDGAVTATDGLLIYPAEGFDIDQYLWLNRVLVVFSDTPADPRFVKQMQMINERPRDLIERDVVVVTDTDPAAGSDIRSRLRPRGFALVLLDKDGVVKLRKPTPWHTREIGRSIDKTPLRREEILDRTGSSG